MTKINVNSRDIKIRGFSGIFQVQQAVKAVSGKMIYELVRDNATYEKYDAFFLYTYSDGKIIETGFKDSKGKLKGTWQNLSMLRRYL